MSPAIEQIVAWAAEVSASPLAGDLVPGTTSEERRSLAALGGLAAALIPGEFHGLPPLMVDWMTSGPVPPEPLVEDLKRALSERHDPLAASYERIVSGRSRRRLGTFFTPPEVVTFMLGRLEQVAGEPVSVVDPGAGVGAFTMAALARWPKADVLAVDVNVVTLGLLAARCLATGLRLPTLLLENYLRWLPEEREGQSETLPRALVGNPPYTRRQEMSAEDRTTAAEAAGSMVDSGHAGLSAYFLAVSLRCLQPADSLCLLLPGSWTETTYGRGIRAELWAMRNRTVELHAFPSKVAVFPGTKVTASILIVGPQGSADRFTVHRTTLTGGKVRPGEPREHSRDQAVPASFGRWLWPSARTAANAGVPLSDVARVRRGVATGANDFFFLTDAQRAPLPEKALGPALMRLRQVPSVRLDAEAHDAIGAAGDRRWLLTLDESMLGEGAVESLLQTGLARGIHRRHLCSTRPQWWRPEDVPPPDILVGIGSKARIRIVRNEIGAIPSNSMYGLYVRDDLADALSWWLAEDAGQNALRAVGRHYASGLIKVEPGALRSVRVPSPRDLLTRFGDCA